MNSLFQIHTQKSGHSLLFWLFEFFVLFVPHAAASVVSSHGPTSATREHEKRILESILPPDLWHLVRGGSSGTLQVGIHFLFYSTLPIQYRSSVNNIFHLANKLSQNLGHCLATDFGKKCRCIPYSGIFPCCLNIFVPFSHTQAFFHVA